MSHTAHSIVILSDRAADAYTLLRCPERKCAVLGSAGKSSLDIITMTPNVRMRSAGTFLPPGEGRSNADRRSRSWVRSTQDNPEDGKTTRVSAHIVHYITSRNYMCAMGIWSQTRRGVD